MKRVLSWIVMVIISVLVALIASIVIGIATYVLSLVSELNTFLQIIIYIFGGSTFLAFIIAPVWYGVPLTLHASEAICKSKKGTRYIVFSVYKLIMLTISIILSILKSDIPIVSIIMCIYYIALIIASKQLSYEYY